MVKQKQTALIGLVSNGESNPTYGKPFWAHSDKKYKLRSGIYFFSLGVKVFSFLNVENTIGVSATIDTEFGSTQIAIALVVKYYKYYTQYIQVC